RVSEPPSGEPYLAISDRTFVTAGALLHFLSQAKAPARFAVENAAWLELTSPLQKLDAPGLYEIGLFAAGAPDWSALPRQVIDLGIKELPPPKDFVPFF